jgi:alpha-N-arabinofuranosidase
MYAPFQDAHAARVTFDAGTYSYEGVRLPRLDAIAAKDKSGKLWLEMTNIDPNNPLEVEIRLADGKPKSAAGEILTAPKVDSVNTFDAPQIVAPTPFAAKFKRGMLLMKIPPKSVTVVSVE